MTYQGLGMILRPADEPGDDNLDEIDYTSSTGSGHNYRQMLKDGDILYVCGWLSPTANGFLHAFDVSDPSDIQLLDSIFVFGVGDSLCKIGDVIFIWGMQGDILNSFDVSDPSDIQHIQGYSPGFGGDTSPTRMITDGSVLYLGLNGVTTNTTCFLTVDPSDPSDMQLMDSLAFANNTTGIRGLAKKGDLVYASCRRTVGWGLASVDVSDPTNISLSNYQTGTDPAFESALVISGNSLLGISVGTDSSLVGWDISGGTPSYQSNLDPVVGTPGGIPDTLGSDLFVGASTNMILRLGFGNLASLTEVAQFSDANYAGILQILIDFPILYAMKQNRILALQFS